MPEKMKEFLARHVAHPLQGMTFGNWWELLRRHHFAVDMKHAPRALVQTARAVGSTTIAEYVENQATFELLRELGVDAAQGFHIGPPAPIGRR